MSKSKQPFGQIVRGLRHERKLTQATCAERAGLPQCRWSQIEIRRGGSVHIDTVLRVAKGLGMPAAEFLGLLGVP